jgi:tRNA1Val (adenine37-N6)-methyltransferase
MKVSTEACILGAWFAKQGIHAKTVLDIGAGTGLLMHMLAQQWSGTMHGIEIDPDAAGQLSDNINRSPWKERMAYYKGDIRSYPFPLTFDFIITNPPFYEKQLASSDPAINLARHSSSLSLEELIIAIDRNLSANGSFGILLPVNRSIIFENLAKARGFFLLQKLEIKQSPSHAYFRTILHMGREKIVEGTQSVLSIRDKDGNYSNEFNQLLNEYYLYL